MASGNEDKSETPSLKAAYIAPNASKTFALQLPAPDTTSTEGKTAYLSALRGSVTKLQEEVNTFLTSRMEEDKALASVAGQKVDDKKEEENYGEEGAEDED